MLNKLAHYNVRTRDWTATRDFYVKVLGLTDGARPQFPFPGHWLYCGDQDVLHITGVEDNAEGVQGYLGDRQGEMQGGGAIDHVAFTAKGAVEMGKHFDALGIKARHRRVPNMDLYQIFIDDPNGITIELNFAGENPPER